MDLSIRDGMLVIGAVMIAVVVLDALRRTYGQRRNEIRLNAKITRTDVPSPPVNTTGRQSGSPSSI